MAKASNRIEERPRLAQEKTSSERELILKAREGDKTAFSRLVERHQDRVYNLAFRLAGRHDQALDLCQEAFLRAFAAIGRFRGESGFFTWVYRIVLNLHMSREQSLSGKADKRSVSLDSPANPGSRSSFPELMDPGDTDPSGPIEKKERDRLIQEALLNLEDDQRQVILLRDMEGLSYEDIAAMLGVPLGTVKSRLHRARQELGALLKKVL